VTLNIAADPAATVTLAGCEVIVGATELPPPALTVRVAALLVTAPTLLVTVTVY
jgi:hypothetical protein